MGQTLGTIVRALEEDTRPTCDKKLPATNNEKAIECGARMVKTIMFGLGESAPQWRCPACTVHLLELLSADGERVWSAVSRDPKDPFWWWVPAHIRSAAAGVGFGVNTHGPRRVVCGFNFDVWCDDGYVAIRASDHRVYQRYKPLEAIQQERQLAQDCQRGIGTPIDPENHAETMRLLLNNVGWPQAGTAGPFAAVPVQAPAPSKNKMMQGKVRMSSSYVAPTVAYQIDRVRVLPETVHLVTAVYGQSIEWHTHEKQVVAVEDGRVVAVVRGIEKAMQPIDDMLGIGDE